MSGYIEHKQVQASGAVQTKQVPANVNGLALAEAVAANSSYITVTELGWGPDHLTKAVVSGLPITLGNTTGVSFGSVALVTFPQAVIHIQAVSVKNFLYDLTDDAGNATPLVGTMGGDFSLGSATTADSSLTGAEVNILAATSYDPFSAAVTANSGINAIIDGSSTPVTCYVNALVDDGDVSDGASDIVEISGEFYFKWYVVR